MKKILFVILSLFITTIAKSDLKFAGNIQSHQLFNDHVEFKLTNANFNVYIINDNIIQFRYTGKSGYSSAPSYAVIYDGKENVKFTLADQGDHFLLSTAELNVEISKSPCRVSIYDKKNNLINKDDNSFGTSFENNEVRCYKKLFADEKFFGLGEKTGKLNKSGTQYTMWNTDRRYDVDSDPLYVSIPFFIGERNKIAYGIFLDNTYKSYFNCGASNNRFYWFGAENGDLNYYFIFGPEIKKVISSYTLLTGRIQLPPLWSLGYQQSRWSYSPESRVKEIAKTFRDKKIPCDVIYLDIDYMNGYRVFTWNKDRFPDPGKMIGELKAEGFKIVPIIDPGIKADTNYFAAKEGLTKNLFVKYPDGVPYEGEVWPSWAYFPDFTKKETREWWGEKLNVMLKQGIEGFWNDMNEPSVWGQAFPDLVEFNDNGFNATHKKIHNVYALEEAKATFDAFQKYSPDKRHFMLSRAGFSGIQRYSAIWTGDNTACEEHLQLACLMPLSMGLSGIPFVGSDVGGFFDMPSSRLYTRWMQLGAFTPFFRGHSVINAPDKEPWAFGNETEENVRNIISFRYKILPYLYNEFYNSSITGLPIMRTMFLNFQNDDECYKDDAQFQFMLGDNILVAPVVIETSNTKKLYLPEGSWIELFNFNIYQGKNWITVDAPINKIPVFLKAGGFIPMQEVQQYVGEKKIDQLEVILYPASSGSYSFYEDDGISYNYKNGEYSITDFSSQVFKNYVVINADKKYNGYETGRNYYLFKILGVGSAVNITDNGTALKNFSREGELNDSNGGYYLDSGRNILFVKVKDEKNIKIKYDR
jgi:alpha-glucosidase